MKRITIFLAVLLAALTIRAGTFSGTFGAVPAWQYTTNYGSHEVRANFDQVISMTHTTGTNANQMQSVAIVSGTLAPLSTNIINLKYGVDDLFGAPLSIDRVRFLAIAAGSANGETFTVGGAETDPFTAAFDGVVSIRRGGAAIFIAPDLEGYIIGTATNLQFANITESNLTYSVWIGGSK